MKKVKKLYLWLNEGKSLFLILILLIGVSFVQFIDIGLYPIYNIKIYGLILQLIGAFTIIRSLRKKLILFKGYGLIKFFLRWLKKSPFLRKKSIIQTEANLVEGPGSTSFDVENIKSPDINNPQDLIRYVDKKLKHLNKRLIQIDEKLHSTISNITINNESTIRILSGKVEENRKKIEDSALSNIWWEIFGVVCIIMGLIFSTIPELIIKIIP